MIAKASDRGFVLDAPTWRAGGTWSEPLGQTFLQVKETNRRAVAFVSAIRDLHETEDCPILINGLVGPAGDAYAPDASIAAQDALLIHAPQIHTLGKAGELSIARFGRAGPLRPAKQYPWFSS